MPLGINGVKTESSRLPPVLGSNRVPFFPFLRTNSNALPSESLSLPPIRNCGLACRKLSLVRTGIPNNHPMSARREVLLPASLSPYIKCRPDAPSDRSKTMSVKGPNASKSSRSILIGHLQLSAAFRSAFFWLHQPSALEFEVHQDSGANHRQKPRRESSV